MVTQSTSGTLYNLNTPEISLYTVYGEGLTQTQAIPIGPGVIGGRTPIILAAFVQSAGAPGTYAVCTSCQILGGTAIRFVSAGTLNVNSHAIVAYVPV